MLVQKLDYGCLPTYNGSSEVCDSPTDLRESLGEGPLLLARDCALLGHQIFKMPSSMVGLNWQISQIEALYNREIHELGTYLAFLEDCGMKAMGSPPPCGDLDCYIADSRISGSGGDSGGGCLAIYWVSFGSRGIVEPFVHNRLLCLPDFPLSDHPLVTWVWRVGYFEGGHPPPLVGSLGPSLPMNTERLARIGIVYIVGRATWTTS